MSRLLARTAEGFSGVMVLRGEPGTGKTALLGEAIAAAKAEGMRAVQLTGVESETQLGYAGLHRLLLPFGRHLERLPGPQRDAPGAMRGAADAGRAAGAGGRPAR
ncbi:MAG TPA: hypothetical protein VMI73_22615 [Trebonia sp.]|nr:hypothetical protein [Trebonia sp.]